MIRTVEAVVDPHGGDAARGRGQHRVDLHLPERHIARDHVRRLPVHGAAHGFLPGRSTLSNAVIHANPKLVLKMDVKDFFPTVTWRRVKGLFRKAGYREQVATLLAMICTEAPREIVEHDGKTFFVSLGPRCLPQGAPTSPGLTNVLCLRMDQRIAGLAKRTDDEDARAGENVIPHAAPVHAVDRQTQRKEGQGENAGQGEAEAEERKKRGSRN